MKQAVIDAMERGIVLLKRYFESEDKFISDIEMGACVISRMYEENGDLDINSELYKEFLRLFIEFVKTEIAEPSPWRFSGICNMLGPGRELYPDKKKYPLWFLPDELMNKEQLKEWKKYLKKSNYKG